MQTLGFCCQAAWALPNPASRLLSEEAWFCCNNNSFVMSSFAPNYAVVMPSRTETNSTHRPASAGAVWPTNLVATLNFSALFSETLCFSARILRTTRKQHFALTRSTSSIPTSQSKSQPSSSPAPSATADKAESYWPFLINNRRRETKTPFQHRVICNISRISKAVHLSLFQMLHLVPLGINRTNYCEWFTLHDEQDESIHSHHSSSRWR